MPQVIRCPNCTTAISVADNSAGKQFRCPSCQNPFTVPAAAPQPAAVGAAAGPARPPSAGSVSLGNINLPPVPPPGTKPPGAAAASTSGTPANCPACGSPLNPGAISCIECGYLLQTEGGAGAEAEGPSPNICSNPACGVANPPGERNCQ